MSDYFHVQIDSPNRNQLIYGNEKTQEEWDLAGNITVSRVTSVFGGKPEWRVRQTQPFSNLWGAISQPAFESILLAAGKAKKIAGSLLAKEPCMPCPTIDESWFMLEPRTVCDVWLKKAADQDSPRTAIGRIEQLDGKAWVIDPWGQPAPAVRYESRAKALGELLDLWEARQVRAPLPHTPFSGAGCRVPAEFLEHVRSAFRCLYSQQKYLNDGDSGQLDFNRMGREEIQKAFALLGEHIA